VQEGEMATSVICGKRLHSGAFGSPSCSPRKIAFLDLAHSEARRAKRMLNADHDGKEYDARKVARGLLETSVSRQHESSPEPSAFMGSSPGELMNEDELGAPKVCRSCKQRPAERLYTSDELREIVQRAVARRENELRAEYDQILQTRLAEQFNNFRKFHEDYVSRQLNQSTNSYIS